MDAVAHVLWLNFKFQAALTEGCRLPVRMHKTEDWPLAEVVSIKDHDGKRQFYVHYVDCNEITE